MIRSLGVPVFKVDKSSLFMQYFVGLSWPSCSKLKTSLVNNLLKFTLSDTQIC